MTWLNTEKKLNEEKKFYRIVSRMKFKSKKANKTNIFIDILTNQYCVTSVSP